MKVCEVCAGARHRWGTKEMCSACSGTGLICLGYESAEKYAALKQQARLHAAERGWYEIVWAPIADGRMRKACRAIAVPVKHSEVA